MNIKHKRNRTSLEKIKEVLDKLDLHPVKYQEIYDKTKDLNINSASKYKHHVFSILIDGSTYYKVGKNTSKYWLLRGWSEYESRIKVKEFYKNKKQRVSPFNINYWLDKINTNTNKLYTKEEAQYKVNSMRPVYPEYWIKKGLNQEEAKIKAKEIHNNNSKIGNSFKIKKYGKDICNFSSTNIKYWINKGYSIHEAKEKLKNRQSTFSLEKCIKKYGEFEGKKRWSQRQEKWKNSFNSSYKYDKNSSVSIDILNNKFNGDKQKYSEYLLKTKNIEIICNLDDFISKVKKIFNDNPYNYYKPINKKIKLFSKIQYDILDLDPYSFFSDIEWNKKGKYKLGTYGYSIWTEEGYYLRSSKEWKFYDLLKKYNIKFEVEKNYNNSSLKCDFYLPDYDMYIEICGFGEKNKEKYHDKMNKKQEKFGCVLLWKENEYENFINELIK